MARGYPDFFGNSVFPWYGPAARALGGVDVPGGGREIIVENTGKRHIYAVQIHTIDADWDKNDGISMYVDGVLIRSTSWWSLLDYERNSQMPTEMWLSCYDEEHHYHVMGFGGGFSIGLSIRIEYTVFGVNPVTVFGQIVSGVIL